MERGAVKQKTARAEAVEREQSNRKQPERSLWKGHGEAENTQSSGCGYGTEEMQLNKATGVAFIISFEKEGPNICIITTP